jgi:hypothetical protein
MAPLPVAADVEAGVGETMWEMVRTRIVAQRMLETRL